MARPGTGDAKAARAEVAALDSIAAQMAERKEPYWADGERPEVSKAKRFSAP